jgi:hypothetical protein
VAGCKPVATSYDHARMGRVKRQELIECHDCGGTVSFTAVGCPHCGSTQPSGPYVMSRREKRRLGQEQRNDRRLVVVTVLCCAIGAAFGALTAPGPWWAAIDGLGYGFVGLLIGVPAAFIINMTQSL